MAIADTTVPSTAYIGLLACLVDAMGGSVVLSEHEYEEYLQNNTRIELQLAEIRDPRAIELKVVHRD